MGSDEYIVKTHFLQRRVIAGVAEAVGVASVVGDEAIFVAL